jgi:hypothetical protein
MLPRFLLLAVFVATFATPVAAQTEGYVGPGIGVAFGNPSSQGLADFVVDFGWLSPEPVGLEIDATYAPSFFGSQGPYGSNSVSTIMGNVVLATSGIERYGSHRGHPTRAYLSGGLGLIREDTASPAISRNDLGTDVGVGIMAAASGQVGVRADVRYFRDLVGKATGNTTSIDFGSFHFWRASVSVLFRF